MTVVLVTGGASGLGLATVKRLVKCGKKVVFCDLEKSKGAEIADELGSETLFVPCDITSTDDVAKLISTIRETFGRLDVCINCAGIFMGGPLYNPMTKASDNLDTIKAVFDVNVFGTYNVMAQATALMAENDPDSDNQRGVIITVASVLAYESPKWFTIYSASKAAIAGMTLPLARELGDMGIRVATIAPGLMDTAMTALLPETSRGNIVDSAAFPKRCGTPEEFASTCEFIIENRFVNGSVIRLDAGLRVPHC